MEKYIAIRDISKKPSYANVNARLLYLHVACNVDVSTYDYSHSYRQLAADLGMSVQSVRTAVKMLEADGLVTTHLATHKVTQGLTHLSTQQLTHLHIVRINEVATTADTTANTPANTPANTQINISSTQVIEIETLTHDARVCEGWKKLLEKEFRLGSDDAQKALDLFFQRQRIKGKKWESQGDALAHLLAFCEKRMPRSATTLTSPSRTRKNDHDARMEEYQRTEEEQKQATRQEKEAEEVERLKRWYHEAIRKKQTKEAETFRQELLKRKAI